MEPNEAKLKLELAQGVLDKLGNADKWRMSNLDYWLNISRKLVCTEQNIDWKNPHTYEENLVLPVLQKAVGLFATSNTGGFKPDSEELEMFLELILRGIALDQEKRNPSCPWNPLTGENVQSGCSEEGLNSLDWITSYTDSVFQTRILLCGSHYGCGRKRILTLAKGGFKHLVRESKGLGVPKPRTIRKPELDTMIRTAEIG